MAAVPIRPRRLVEHAHDLIAHHEAAGRPRPIWLRRAVSAAYYAVFHGVSLATVEQLAPNATAEERFRLARSLEHSRLAEVCSWVSGRTPGGKRHTQPIVAILHARPELRQLGDIVRRLQEERHRADYDHLADFDKATALSPVQQAERALDLLDGFRGDPDLERFLALIALHTQQVR